MHTIWCYLADWLNRLGRNDCLACFCVMVQLLQVRVQSRNFLMPPRANIVMFNYAFIAHLLLILCLHRFICCTIISVCSFFIILYGLKFGKVKSILWIASVATAVLHDIFILTPLKILLSSFLLSLTLDVSLLFILQNTICCLFS